MLFGALGVLWGLPYFMIRVAVRQMDPATLVFSRTAVAAIVLIPLATHRRAFASLRGAWGWLALYSVVEMGIPWFCMSTAERHLTSSLTGLLVTTTPLLAVVLTRLLRHGEHISRRRLVGLAIGFAGVVSLVGLSASRTSIPWIALMAVVVVGYTCGPMIIARRLQHADGLAVVAGSVGLVALAYSPIAALSWPAHLGAETAESVAGLGLLCTAAAFLVFFALIKEIGPSRTVVVTYVNTAVAVVLGVLALSEPFTTGIAVGFPLIVVGSYFATTQGLQRS